MAMAAVSAACTRKTAQVPTRPAPRKPSDLGPDLDVELLDTEDGVVTIDRLDPQLGPREATCVIVVFSDFQCPFCKDIAQVLDQLRKELPTKLRIVFKHLPMLSLHRYAREAATASQIVFLEAGTDAFFRFHDHAFAHQREIDTDTLLRWVRDEGVRAEAIAARAKEAEDRVSLDFAQANKLGIHGTPHLYVNARTVNGSYPYEQMRAWINEEI